MSGHGFIVSSSGYDDEDRLANWRLCETHAPIVDRHSVSEFAPAIYSQDGQQTIADNPSRTADNRTYTYVYASHIDQPVMRGGSGGLRYYHRTQQDSITAVSDGGGAVVERYAYSAYCQGPVADAWTPQVFHGAL